MATKPAKKTVASKPGKVTVILIKPSHGAPAGTPREVTSERAEVLVRRGLARRADVQA